MQYKRLRGNIIETYKLMTEIYHHEISLLFFGCLTLLSPSFGWSFPCIPCIYPLCFFPPELQSLLVVYMVYSTRQQLQHLGLLRKHILLLGCLHIWYSTNIHIDRNIWSWHFHQWILGCICDMFSESGSACLFPLDPVAWFSVLFFLVFFSFGVLVSSVFGLWISSACLSHTCDSNF